MRSLKLIFFLISILVILSTDHLINHPEEAKVYICNSTGATKYHLKSNCRGLNACESKVIEVTKEEAYTKGKKTLCGWED